MKDFASLIAHISQKPIKKDISNYDCMLSFGYFWPDIPDCKKLFVLHPLFIKETSFIQSLRYEIGTEFGISWLLAHTLYPLLKSSNPMIEELKTKLKQLDVGYLSSETNLAEEELESISAYLKNFHKPLGIILGKELVFHPNAQDIALIWGIIGSSQAVDIIMPELMGNITPVASSHHSLHICEDLPESNGNFIYMLSSNVSRPILKIPLLFAPTLGLKNGQPITLSFESQCINATCEYNSSQKGTIGLLYLPQTQEIGYPYKKVEVIL